MDVLGKKLVGCGAATYDVAPLYVERADDVWVGRVNLVIDTARGPYIVVVGYEAEETNCGAATPYVVGPEP